MPKPFRMIEEAEGGGMEGGRDDEGIGKEEEGGGLEEEGGGREDEGRGREDEGGERREGMVSP